MRGWAVVPFLLLAWMPAALAQDCAEGPQCQAVTARGNLFGQRMMSLMAPDVTYNDASMASYCGHMMSAAVLRICQAEFAAAGRPDCAAQVAEMIAEHQDSVAAAAARVGPQVSTEGDAWQEQCGWTTGIPHINGLIYSPD